MNRDPHDVYKAAVEDRMIEAANDKTNMSERTQPKWNHYVCPECGGVTIARHDDEGVTPFIIRCRVKDQVSAEGRRAHGCEGAAESQFFDVSQDDNQKPHVIFYRPLPGEAIEAINKEPQRDRVWLFQHYENGGALMKEA